MTFTDPVERERIYDDLKGVVRGALRFDDLSRALYSSDASPFQITPLGVVQPADEADVQALVRYAHEHQVPLVARGAGTGVAGESLGPGLVVDLSRNFRRILNVGRDTITVQPGVVLREVQRELALHDRRLGPDPCHLECTLGGMIATNASGGRALRFGYTRDHVDRLRVVLDSGHVVEASRHPRWPFPDPDAAAGGQRNDRFDDIITGLFALLDQHGDTLRKHRPRTPWNRCGYLLHDVLSRDQLDLARLLVGSEGTLAITTEATLRTVPLPGGRAVVLLGCEGLEAAVRAAGRAILTGPVACDLLDRRLLQLLRGGPDRTASLIPNGVEALLLIEFEGHTPAEARAAAGMLADAFRRDRLALWSRLALSEEEIATTWRVREHAVEQLYTQRGSAPPASFLEDVAVPTPVLSEYLVRVQALLRKHEITATFLLHAATGQVHMRPFLDLSRREHAARAWNLAEDVYRLVLELGGTISTQHGTGLARTPWVEAQYGPLVGVFRQLKALFDPAQIFNPGKIVGKSLGVPFWPLRRQADRSAEIGPASAEEETTPGSVTLSPGLRVSLSVLEAEAQRCNGCGECRSTSSGQRMCPIFRVLPTEEATPRAKANLLRHLLSEDGDPRRLASSEVRAIADLCVNCRMCARECPSRVDIPRLMLATKAAHAEQQGLDRADAVLARTEGYAWLGSLLAPFVNAALRTRPFRWSLEKLLGLSSQRRLPAFAATSFLRLAQRRGWSRKPTLGGSSRPRVAFFVDLFANYNDPSIAEAVVAVLHHNGIEVYVPPRQHGCGMAPLAVGDLDSAREAVQANFRELADLAREGFPILCAEPTAALMFREDARFLVPGPDADLIATATVEFTSYLWNLHEQGRLRTDFQPLALALGHHVPCHLKAIGVPIVGPDLLRLVPGLRVHTIDVSCSGMAGFHGLRADAYETSLAAGAPMLAELARPRVVYGSTECSTCRIQMEDGSNKRTLHPAQYLALAYGLLPELRARLERPVGRRVL